MLSIVVRRAEAEGCDFPGLGPHSWRQEVGGSAIEASKIAGHNSLEMTGEYAFVRNAGIELTRRIQQKLATAAQETDGRSSKPVEPVTGAPDVPPTVADTEPITTVAQ